MRSARHNGSARLLAAMLECWVSLHSIIQDLIYIILLFGSSNRPCDLLQCLGLLYEFIFDDLLIFYVVSIYWKSTSYRSALDLATLGKLHNRSALSWLNSFHGTSCMLFDLSIALRLCHVSLAVAMPTHRLGACGIWVPLGHHLSIASRLRHVSLAVATPTHRSGLVRHGYPWVPTYQGLSRPRQVGPAYQKTR